MPYIKQEDRKRLVQIQPKNCGELNYVLSEIVDQYLTDHGGAKYRNYNDVIGVIECMKLELYRRFVGPYEDEKLAENGEVFFHDHNRVKLPYV